jgi:hypothetical protein
MKLFKHLGCQSLYTFGCKATFAAWQELSVAYVYCLNDGINRYPSQMLQVEKMEKDIGEDITVFKCDSAHHPTGTDRDALVRFIRIFAGELEMTKK